MPNADPKVKLSLLARSWPKKNNFTVAGSHEYEEKDSKHTVQSSLKSHPL